MHYKFLKKIIGTIGFKLVDKNLIKNDRLLSQYSGLSLKRILNNLFLNNKIKSIIQIGANDGQRFDILNDFIKKYCPFVVFLEPIKSNFDKLKKNYSNQKNLFFENLAISVNNEISQLYKVKDTMLHSYDDHVVGITSFIKQHLVNHGIKKNHIIKVDVKSISIKDLLEKHSIKNLDLISIDTEGYDGSIVIDFLNNTKLRPIIIFEYIHINDFIFKKTLDLLNECNYIFFNIDENIICIQKVKVKELQLF
jgi:FkbM family methyltransferase